jgi:hypothetical protein
MIKTRPGKAWCKFDTTFELEVVPNCLVRGKLDCAVTNDFRPAQNGPLFDSSSCF